MWTIPILENYERNEPRNISYGANIRIFFTARTWKFSCNTNIQKIQVHMICFFDQKIRLCFLEQSFRPYETWGLLFPKQSNAHSIQSQTNFSTFESSPEQYGVECVLYIQVIHCIPSCVAVFVATCKDPDNLWASTSTSCKRSKVATFFQKKNPRIAPKTFNIKGYDWNVECEFLTSVVHRYELFPSCKISSMKHFYTSNVVQRCLKEDSRPCRSSFRRIFLATKRQWKTVTLKRYDYVLNTVFSGLRCIVWNIFYCSRTGIEGPEISIIFLIHYLTSSSQFYQQAKTNVFRTIHW